MPERGSSPRGPLARSRAMVGAVIRFAGRRGVWATLLVGAGALLEGVGILLLVPLLALLFDPGSGAGAAAGERGALVRWAVGIAPDRPPLERLALLLAGFAVLIALRGLVLWRRDLLLAQLQIGFVENLRARLAHGLANARWQRLAQLGHGRVTHLMGGDIQRCGAAVHFLFQSGVALVMLAGLALLALLLSPLLSAIAGALLLTGALALVALNRRAGDAGRGVTEASLALMTGLGQFLGGMKLAMSQNLQRGFVAAFERDLNASARSQAGFIGQQAMLRGLWGLLAAAVAGTVLLAGFGWLGLPAPLLIAFLAVLARASAPALQIQLGIQQIAYSLPAWDAVERMSAELALAAAPLPLPEPEPQGAPLSGTIAFEKVSYRHGGGEAGVSGITLRLMPSEFVGLAGPSGAGKTTLVDLLAGLLHPQRGRIAVGGVALNENTAPRWRERIAYAAQNPFLFHGSIRANLLWSCPDASADDLARALALVGAEPLIASLPEGLGTRVGEKGASISGGERQRLALARALLRRPELLILDEATSAIDPAGERALLERLRALTPRPTVVMIAHRAESLAFCDRVLSLEAGRLVSERRAGIAA
jgi:ATP-binding cassette, subfamily C, bacterial